MQWPIDMSQVRGLLYANHEAVVDFETKAPTHDKDSGFPVFRVNLMRFDPAGGRPEAVAVKVVGEPTGLAPATAVRCENLTVQFWEVGGKAGISFRADAIRPVTATKAAA